MKPATTCPHKRVATHKKDGKVVRVECLNCGIALPISDYGDSGKVA